MRKFSFLRPNTQEDQKKNWHSLIEGTDCREWDATGGNTMVSLGWTSAGDPIATYSRQGPICHFNILIGYDLSWSAGAVLILPFKAASRGAGTMAGIITPQDFLAIQYGFGGVADLFRYYIEDGVQGGKPHIKACIGSSAAGLDPLLIQGWYFI